MTPSFYLTVMVYLSPTSLPSTNKIEVEGNRLDCEKFAIQVKEDVTKQFIEAFGGLPKGLSIVTQCTPTEEGIKNETPNSHDA